MSNNKVKKWDIFLPEPFILDEKISDEDIIAHLAEAKNENEISSIFASAMQPPIESYTITCTEKELIEILTNDEDGLIIELQQYDDIYIISIRDNDGVLIGRGEIAESSPAIESSELKRKFDNKLSSFKKRYDEGTKRMNNFVYTLKNLSKSIKSKSKKLN